MLEYIQIHDLNYNFNTYILHWENLYILGFSIKKVELQSEKSGVRFALQRPPPPPPSCAGPFILFHF